MRDIIIVGAGHAGAQAAADLRERGFDGTIMLVGGESHAPYHRPPLSKAFLKDGGDPPFIKAEAFYPENGIDLRLDQTVVAIDRIASAVHFSDGTEAHYDGLILTTGASLRHAPVEGADLQGIHMLRTLEDAGWLRERLVESGRAVIVGGGFIGLEVAATARALGVEVTVLELAPRLMARAVAPQISAHMLNVHRDLGSDIRLGTGLARFHGSGGLLTAVETGDGEMLETTLAVVGIGVVPNVELAAAAGLEVTNGIVVDAAMCTTDPKIVAAGDCVAFPYHLSGEMLRLESVQNAHDQARQAVATLLGEPKDYSETPWFWSDQGPVKLQMVGLALDADTDIVRGSPEDGAFSVFRYVGETLRAVESVNKPGDHMLGRRMLSSGFEPSPAEVGDVNHDLKAAFMTWQKAARA
ncbi:MAG: FAD-dependent oxidoreductase [Pseudomonadota bacterium]